MKIAYVLNIAAVALTLGVAPASAVVFTGSTQGCFGPPCTLANSAVDQKDLTFQNAAFSSASLTPILGTFSLVGGGGNPTFNEVFELAVTFSAPLGSTGNFTADVTGSVHGGAGTAFIDFSSSPAETFSYDGGSFTLSIGNVTLNLDGTPSRNLTGTIVLAVPETSTWAMMLLGFACIGFMAYRGKSRPAFRFA
jgi:hypothetical protein